jgi:hypothetical protein
MSDGWIRISREWAITASRLGATARALAWAVLALPFVASEAGWRGSLRQLALAAGMTWNGKIAPGLDELEEAGLVVADRCPSGLTLWISEPSLAPEGHHVGDQEAPDWRPEGATLATRGRHRNSQKVRVGFGGRKGATFGDQGAPPLATRGRHSEGDEGDELIPDQDRSTEDPDRPTPAATSVMDPEEELRIAQAKLMAKRAELEARGELGRQRRITLSDCGVPR